jgi:hypothetical protein
MSWLINVFECGRVDGWVVGGIRNCLLVIFSDFLL